MRVTSACGLAGAMHMRSCIYMKQTRNLTPPYCTQTFYGKRDYKPSGSVEGDYEGLGLSDIRRIKKSEEAYEQYLEDKRQAQSDTEK